MFGNAKNAINHFINEESRIAVELLEGHVCSDVEISTKGLFKRYADNTTEFIWKGKTAIIFRPEVTANGIELIAEHMYDNHEQVTIDARNEV